MNYTVAVDIHSLSLTQNNLSENVHIHTAISSTSHQSAMV